MPEESAQLPDVSQWRAFLLRLTAFPSQPADSSGWWEQLTGEEPEETTIRKAEQNYQGPFRGHRLGLHVLPFRVQWVLQPAASFRDSESLPNVGTLPTAVDDFGELMQRWLASAPKLKRLAFGATLHQPVESRAAGYRLLDQYLPFVQLDEKTSDFRFTINRARASATGIDRLKINRLMTWSTLQVLVTAFQAHEGQLDHSTAGVGTYACQLGLDVNTAQDFPSELPMERLIDIWQELIALSLEIAAEGDKP